MERVAFNGWENTVRLANDEVEVLVTADVGPRVIRFGFIGGPNVFAEIQGHQGGRGEDEWMLRGGHRLWIAPEDPATTYELDNESIEVQETEHGIRTVQKPGPLTGVQKRMEIELAPEIDAVTVRHSLQNCGDRAVELAPWGLSVMAPDGMAVIPLPAKVAHGDRLTHNQEWSLWGYTDFTDPRWTLGSRYVLFRQDRTRGPNKLGIAHREGWVAYQLGDVVFVKRFIWVEGAAYPDGGVNFETFSNEQFLEIESLGALVELGPGEEAGHREIWELHRGVPACRTEADVDEHIRPLVD